jgi:hypothetical protein
MESAPKDRLGAEAEVELHDDTHCADLCTKNSAQHAVARCHDI